VGDLEINSNLQVIRAEIPSATKIMKRHCKFMLLTTVALFGFAPALGQTVAPAGPTSRGIQDGASVPDFSGTWARPYFGVEPPLSGPGPVTNNLRCTKISQCAPFQGRDGVESYFGMVGDYTNPILKPQAADSVKKYGEIELSGRPNATARSECWPDGVPLVFAFEEGMHCSSNRTRSPLSMTTIIKSGTCV
jgi:hypothetical protein